MSSRPKIDTIVEELVGYVLASSPENVALQKEICDATVFTSVILSKWEKLPVQAKRNGFWMTGMSVHVAVQILWETTSYEQRKAILDAMRTKEGWKEAIAQMLDNKKLSDVPLQWLEETILSMSSDEENHKWKM